MACSGSANFGQQPFVHTPPAGYEGLYQVWSEWVGATTLALLAASESRVDVLEQVLRDVAVPYERHTQYPIHSIVDIGGDLYESVVDGADVTAADFLAKVLRGESTEWVKLDIRTREMIHVRPEPTPAPTPEPTPDFDFNGGSTSGAVTTGF